MPYLEYLFCENCGDYARLDIDPAATIEAYREEGRKSTSILQPTLIWDYLIYSCGICGRKYKYTYRDVEERVRKYFSSLSKEFKDYFDQVIMASKENQGEAYKQEELPPKTFDNKQSKVKERVRNLYTAKNYDL